MSADPLVSVGLPTYNRPESLRHALECLTGQSYRNLEIVVSDNASPGDETANVIESFSRVDPRIKHTRQDRNIGADGNFNFVFAHATGKYFAWFADDDHCEPTFIEALVRPMEADPDIGLAMSDVRFIQKRSAVDETMDLASIRLEQARGSWSAKRRLFFAYPTSHVFICIYGLFRTEILRRCRTSYQSRWKEIAYGSEVPFLAQIAVRAKVVSIPGVLKTYYSHDASMYMREQSRLTRLDRLIRDTEIRLELTSVALRSRLPLRERLELGVVPWMRR